MIILVHILMYIMQILSLDQSLTIKLRFDKCYITYILYDVYQSNARASRIFQNHNGVDKHSENRNRKLDNKEVCINLDLVYSLHLLHG